MKNSVMLLGVTLCLILAVAVVAYSAEGSAERGKQVYTAQKCQMCHSVAGVGNKKSPLDGVGGKLSPEDMKKWVKTPKAMKPDTKMKAYPNIPDKDLEDLVAYMMTLK